MNESKYFNIGNVVTSKYFSIGKIVVTHGINKAMNDNSRFAAEVKLSLRRYVAKDWGDMGEEYKQSNEDALNYPNDLYLIAVYQTCKGKIWIITEHTWENLNGNTTLVCFPDERLPRI